MHERIEKKNCRYWDFSLRMISQPLYTCIQVKDSVFVYMCCLFEEIDDKITVSFGQAAFSLLWYADLQQITQILNVYLKANMKLTNGCTHADYQQIDTTQNFNQMPF